MESKYPIQIKKIKYPSPIERIYALIVLLSFGGFLVYDTTMFGLMEGGLNFLYYFGYIILAICPLVFIIIIIKWNYKHKPLFICENRFKYYSGWTNYEIFYSDITSIEVVKPSKDLVFLLIIVRNPKEVINVQKRQATQLFLKFYHHLYETPVVINPLAFEIGTESLIYELNRAWKLSKQDKNLD